MIVHLYHTPTKKNPVAHEKKQQPLIYQLYQSGRFENGLLREDYLPIELDFVNQNLVDITRMRHKSTE